MADYTHNFEIPLKDFVKAVGKGHRQVVRRLAADIFERLAERTPVRTGRARSGWDMSLRAPSDYMPDAGLGPFPEPKADLSGITGKEQVWITNNVEYVPYLEQGTSKQAPVGMTLIVLAEIKTEMEDIISQALAMK